MIDEARRLNYKLVTIGECMGDPKGNWYRDAATGQAYEPAKTSSSKSPSSAEDRSQDNKGPAAGAVGHASTGAGPKAPIATGFRFGPPGCNGWGAVLYVVFISLFPLTI